MDVLVDTSVWSLALRRRSGSLGEAQVALLAELSELVRGGRVVMVGPVRQELLSGIRDIRVFEAVRERLAAFEDLPLGSADYEEAAAIGNRCRAAGVAGSAVDFLICAAAVRRDLALFTMDADFVRYAEHAPLMLHAAR